MNMQVSTVDLGDLGELGLGYKSETIPDNIQVEAAEEVEEKNPHKSLLDFMQEDDEKDLNTHETKKAINNRVTTMI